MPRRKENGLREGNQSYEDKYKQGEGDILCDIKNHKPYLDIKYEELQNLNIFQSDKEDNAEFIMINPDLLDLEMKDRDIVSNALIVSAISDNLILPNYVFLKYVHS